MSIRTARLDNLELRQKLDDQTDRLDALAAELAEIRALVGRGQTEVLRRIQELQTAANHQPPAAVPQPTWPLEPEAPDAGVEAEVVGPVGTALPAITPADYARLVTRIRALVRTVVPAEAIVAVASRGDDGLVDLDGRIGWHFPRCDDGRYAGHHPRDSNVAVTHLEDLRRRGARYLVFPATALWWLEHYDGLRLHLEDNYRIVVSHEDACLIFNLDRQETQ
ncbi:MAG TPA: hypothetical protein VF711_04910 [Acidimicrobiales bacterium]|jgi:uncharacterized coiled-coil protein SlyX